MWAAQLGLPEGTAAGALSLSTRGLSKGSGHLASTAAASASPLAAPWSEVEPATMGPEATGGPLVRVSPVVEGEAVSVESEAAGGPLDRANPAVGGSTAGVPSTAPMPPPWLALRGKKVWVFVNGVKYTFHIYLGGNEWQAVKRKIRESFYVCIHDMYFYDEGKWWEICNGPHPDELQFQLVHRRRMVFADNDTYDVDHLSDQSYDEESVGEVNEEADVEAPAMP